MGLVEIVPKDNEYLQETTVRFMMENAMLLAPKIAELALLICTI